MGQTTKWRVKGRFNLAYFQLTKIVLYVLHWLDCGDSKQGKEERGKGREEFKEVPIKPTPHSKSHHGREG
jgi:hypothetical protein